MDDNRIEIVAGLDIPKTKSTIKEELRDEVKPDLDSSKALKIVCHIDETSVASLQAELTKISKGLKLSVPTITVKTETVGANNITSEINKSVENTDHKIKVLKKTLADLDEQFTKPFKARIDTDGLINAERTMSVIQNRLSSLGTVTVTGKYNDDNSPDSLYKIQATIAAMSGEVRTLNFLLDETDDKFKLLDSAYSDKGVVKVQQDIARLEKELASFEQSHTSIKSGLTDPLKEASDALIDLKAGAGSVEAVEQAIDKLKTAAATIGANLKSSGSSFNIFDNAVNKAKNFENVLKGLSSDINSLGESSNKSDLLSQLTKTKELVTALNKAEAEGGKNKEWSEYYKQINATIQEITNNLKATQKEEKNVASLTEEITSSINALNAQSHNRTLLGNISNEVVSNQIGDINNLKKEYEQLLAKLKEGGKPNVMADVENELQRLESKFNDVISSAKDLQYALRDDKALEIRNNKIKQLSADMEKYANANKRAVKSTQEIAKGETFESRWLSLVERLGNASQLSDIELQKLISDYREFGKLASANGLAGESAIGKFLNSFKTMSSYITANMVFNFVKRQIRELADEVTAVDTAMTELRKVTEATNEEFEAFARSAGKTGRELGSSISDVINATATFARLGGSLPDAEELGRVAVLYKNVGDGISEETAAEDLISTMKAFNIEAKDSIQIVDKLNEVETCPFYILVERNRRHIFSNCWEILKSFSLLFSKRRKSETSKRITYGEKKHIQSAKVVCVLSVV